MADPVQTAPPPSPASPPVAASGAPNAPANAAPGTDAAALAAKHGGYRGGRPRKDGLVPGSPEAILADREKEAQRKRIQRQREAAILAATKGPSLPGLADPGAPPASGPAPVPWDPGTLRPIFDQLVPAAEKFMVSRVVGRAAKLDCQRDLLAEIEKDAAWPGPAKTALQATGPLCVAKWLNQSGIGAENAPEVILATAVAGLIAHHLMLSAKLERIIQANAPTKPKPDAPAPKPA